MVVKNMSRGEVVLLLKATDHGIGFRRTLKPNATVKPPEDVADILRYDDGFEAMTQQGFISIIDEASLPAAKTETVSAMLAKAASREGQEDVYVLSLAEVEKLLDDGKIATIAKVMNKAAAATNSSIAQVAIKKRLADSKLCALILEKTGVDVLAAVKLSDEVEAAQGV